MEKMRTVATFVKMPAVIVYPPTMTTSVPIEWNPEYVKGPIVRA